MFTGIISDIGCIAEISRIPAGLRTRIATVYDPDGIDIGASIACDGVCHTVTAKGRDGETNWFEIESAAETLKLTTVGNWTVGARVNLERSLKIGDELGGHIVQGHVDATAEIVERTDHPDSVCFRFRVPAEFAPFIARKGGVALDGTSLTVNEVDGDTFSVFLIPHTLTATTWADRKAGDLVNLEVDMMARYAARLAEYR
ncbi:riboflavin synthase [Stappia stellulata]|uniref:riboflavin synthase n=1 Tax=Stappia stellulata TaxID=71235 RepID=UPI0003F5ACA4|nr:riboflavin synthase [Stappia stellulata]